MIGTLSSTPQGGNGGRWNETLALWVIKTDHYASQFGPLLGIAMNPKAIVSTALPVFSIHILLFFLFVAHLLLRANSACMTTLFSTQWRDFQPRYYSSFITFTRFYFTLLPVSFSFFICCHFSPSRHFCVLFLYTGICSLILSLPLPPICYFYTLPS